MNEIPVGTRVMFIGKSAFNVTPGCVGLVTEPEEFRAQRGSDGVIRYGLLYIAEFHGHEYTVKRTALRPLPPEDDVTAYDRKNRDVPMEVA